MIVKSSTGRLNFTFSDKETGDLLGILARAEHYWQNINVGNDKCSTTEKDVHPLHGDIQTDRSTSRYNYYRKGSQEMKPQWEVWLSWWLSGIVCGLTIAQIMVNDPVISEHLLMWSFGILALNLILVICVAIKVSHD